MSSKETSFSIESDKPRDHCAVVGIISFTGRDVADDARISLHNQQNRGEDGSGIAVYSDYAGTFKLHKDIGMVSDVFPAGKLDEKEMHGSMALGHNRYATSGSRELDHKGKINSLHPYVVAFDKKSLALVHNGNILPESVEKMRSELPPGIPYQSDTDSEVMAWRFLFAKGDTWREKIINGASGIVGAYSIVIGTDDGEMFGIKDPLGIRPLVVARMEDGVALVSETHGLARLKGVEGKFEVGNGEMVHVKKNGEIKIDKIFPEVGTAKCLIEPIYFKNPFSREGGSEVRVVRQRMGEMLAKEFQAPEDWVIIGVPDSGVKIAEGYARALGRNNEQLIEKDRYRPHRTFISESKEKREQALELKFLISDDVEGKKLVIVDDSVIRGSTTRRLINSLKEKGALEVHVLSGSPKFIETCDLGVDIPTHEELQALGNNNGNGYEINPEDQIARDIGADSIHYISLNGLIDAVGGEKKDFCTNCFTGDHPIKELGEELIPLYTAHMPTSVIS